MSKKLLLEGVSLEETKEHIKELYHFLRGEMPKIDKAPKVFFRQDQTNADDYLGKTGYYDPQTYEIHLYVTDRHGKDVLRSFAHEMVHHEQNCSGFTSKLDMSKTTSPDYAEHDEGLYEAERDAFERGNMLFRKWTDRLKAKLQKEKEVMSEVKKKKKKRNPVEDAQEAAKKDARKHMENYMGKDVKNMKEQSEEAQENLEENTLNTPYPQLFTPKDRVMQDAFQKREKIVFDELVKRFTNQEG